MILNEFKKMAIKHKSLVTTIVENIEEKILDGLLKPGERIIEQELCEELGVSRSPVREALIILENQGFLVRRARKGVSVAMVTQKEAVDAYIIRANLESLATYLAVKNNRPGLVNKLKKINEKLEQASLKKNSKKYFRLNKQFHQTLIADCENNQLIQMLSVFDKQTARYRKEVLSVPGQLDESLKRHEKLIKSLEDGNAEDAEKIRKQSILGNIKYLKQKFENEEVRFEDKH